MILLNFAVMACEKRRHQDKSCHQSDLLVKLDVTLLTVNDVEIHQGWSNDFSVFACGPLNEALF